MTILEGIAQLEELSAKIRGSLPKLRPARYRMLTKAEAFGAQPPWMTGDEARQPGNTHRDELEEPTDEERSHAEAEWSRANREIAPLLKTWREVWNQLEPQLAAAIGRLTAKQDWEADARATQAWHDALGRYAERELRWVERNLAARKSYAFPAAPRLSDHAMTALKLLEKAEAVGPRPATAAPAAGKPAKGDAEALCMACLIKHPHWNNQQIAAGVRINPASMTRKRMPRFFAARDAALGVSTDIQRGQKAGGGDTDKPHIEGVYRDDGGLNQRPSKWEEDGD